MRRLPVFLASAVGSAAALLACGASRTPEPSFVAHPTSALVEVPYPPPPARVEVVPAQARKDAVWLDGEWVWQGRTWAWRTGRWVVPPSGAAYAPWTTVRSDGGILYAAEGRFRRRDGTEVEPTLVLTSGRARGGPVVTPEGDLLEGTSRASLPPPSGDGGNDLPPEWDAGIEPFVDASFEDAIPLPPLREPRRLDASP